MMKKKKKNKPHTPPFPQREMFGDYYNCELVSEKVVEQERCENKTPPKR